MAAALGVRVFRPWLGAGLGWVVRALLLLLWFAARGGALYFHIGETEKKCFIEEIPDETMVIGAGGKGTVGNKNGVLGRGVWEGQQRSRAGSSRPRRALPAADPESPLTWARPASLQETTGRSCMTSSGRSTSPPPPDSACS